MPMSVASTRYGRPALEELSRLVEAAKRSDPLAPVTVLVPSQVASVVVRRHLARGVAGSSGIAGLFLSTVNRFAERVAAPLLAPRRPATRAIVAAAWRNVLADNPGRFKAIGEHQSTITALLRVHRELRALDDHQLALVAEGTGLSADVVRLYREVQCRLSDRFYDEADLLRTATEHLASRPRLASEFGTVVLYLPQDLTTPQLDLVAALSGVVDLAVVAGFTGLARPDRVIGALLDRLDVRAKPASRPVPTASRVLHASDSDDEVRWVVREILTDLQSVPAHRIAILYGSATPYARLLHEHLTTAGIRHNGPGSRPIIERSIPQGVIRLLDSLSRDLPRADLFAALSAARITLADGSAAPVGRWERISRLAGVVAGDDWDRRLLRYADREQQRAVEEQRTREPSEARIRAIQGNVAQALSLREFAMELSSQAAAVAKLGWEQLSAAAIGAFHRYFGDPEELLQLPIEERNAARDVELALRNIAALAAFEPGPVGLSRLLDVLTAELEAAIPRVGRFGEGAFVGPISAAVGLDVDVAYVVGLAEDLYPGTLHPEPLISEPLRRASTGALRTQRDEVDTRHRHLLAAFEAAPEVIACFPRGNLRRNQHRLPSRWLMPTLRTLTETSDLMASRWDTVRAATIGESASYATEVEQTSLPANAQEWRARAVRSGTDGSDPVVEAATQMIGGRAEPILSRYDGLVMADGLPDYTDGQQMISPTRLEEYAGCPYAFFVRRLLGVEPLENPEEIITIPAMEIGTLMHEAMDAMITEFSDGRLPGYGEPWHPVHRRRLQDHAIDLAQGVEERGLTGHPRLWRAERTRILRDLDRMLRDDDRWRAEYDAKVLASELSFGIDRLDPVRLDLGEGGGTVLLKGKADRVDQTRDGVLVVTDIKTGRPDSYKKLARDPVVDGTKLQLPAYAYAAQNAYGGEAVAQYWFVRKTIQRIQVTLNEATASRYRDAVAILVGGIAHGWFPAIPPDTDFGYRCAYCSPDGVGPDDLRRRWNRKRHDEALRTLVSLIDPSALAGDSR